MPLKWICPICGREFTKHDRNTQGLARAADNHLRSHHLNRLERRKELNKRWPPKPIRTEDAQ